MSLAKTFTVMCDVCGAWDGIHHGTSSHARRAARRVGFKRLPNPVSVEKGYVKADGPRRRLDYCPQCAPAIQGRLDSIADRGQDHS